MKCLFCNNDAIAYCDKPLAMVIGGTVKRKGKPPHNVTTMEAMLSCSYTCDAPICSEHGKVVGHVCGKDHDTIDHCVKHLGPHHRHPLMTPEQIDGIRRSLHAQWRRERVSGVFA